MRNRIVAGIIGALLLIVAAWLIQRQMGTTISPGGLLHGVVDVPAVPDRPLAEIMAERGWDRVPDVSLLVDKSDHTLALLSAEDVVKTYPIALGSDSLDDKRKRDDLLTPEGSFYICQRNLLPAGRRWDCVWLRLSYPDAEDARRGLAEGLITPEQARAIERAIAAHETPLQDTDLGSGIGIHAGGVRPRNWTGGCIALQERHAYEIYRQTRLGTTVVIRK